MPTEYLQEDLQAALELPADAPPPGPFLRLVAAHPGCIALSVWVFALVCALWVLIAPADKFSVDDTLFTPRADPDVELFDAIGALDRISVSCCWCPTKCAWYLRAPPRESHRRLSAAGAPLRPAADSEWAPRLPPSAALNSSAWASDRMLAETPVEGECAPAGGMVWQNWLTSTVTIVYERRGVGAPNVLDPRQLASIHRIEAQLSAWVDKAGVCARDANCECVPLASALSYLYPTPVDLTDAKFAKRVADAVGPGATSAIRFDGGAGVAAECAPPPFDQSDVSELVHWLGGRGIRGYFAAGSEAAADTGAESRYLRTTLYMDKAKMEHELGEVDRSVSEQRWYELAETLESASRSWYVRMYYGSDYLQLALSQLLMALNHDLWLLAVALSMILLYMRMHFGGWRLAGLAAGQIVLSLPIM